MNVHFIYNPRSGPKRANIAEALRTFASERRLSAQISATTARGHATELAHAAVRAGADVVVAVGGDGTVNEVGRALVGTPVPMGIVPRGSGNGLARQLGVPLGLQAALTTIVRGHPRVIDTGLANDHLFLCTMGVGFDAAVVRRFEALPRRGMSAYIGAAALEFLHYRRQPLTFGRVGEAGIVRRPFFTVVANAAQFGNGALIAPEAQPDDGRLELVSVGAVTLFNTLPLLWRLFRGTLHRSHDVLTMSGTRFFLERATPGPMHVDGELVQTAARIEIAVRVASLRVVAP